MSFIDYFLPTGFRGIKPTDLETAEAIRKFRLNVIFCLTIGTLVTIIFFTRLILEPDISNTVFLNLFVIGTFFIMPFGIRSLGLRHSVFYFGCSLSTIIVFIRAVDSGGITSPIANWLTIFPLIGLLIVGRKVATITLIGVCAIFFVLALPETFDLTISTYKKSPYIKPLVLSFVTLVVFMLASLYETQRKYNEGLILKIEQELSSSKKLASLGGLSGGLAHEINNPLTILSGRITSLNRMLLKDDYDRDKMLHACASAMQSVKRIDSIVNALRAFSRNEYVEDLKEVDVVSIIKESLDTLEEDDLKHIRFAEESKSLLVMGNSVLLQRVFTNLLGNSLQAIAGMDSPWIEVRKVSSEPLTLSFKDSGAGISPEVAEHMMEPFYTTKAVGQGSGLGLSLCQNIMSLHGGSLKLNQDCENTEFLVTFSG